jgi:hypothetical protein
MQIQPNIIIENLFVETSQRKSPLIDELFLLEAPVNLEGSNQVRYISTTRDFVSQSSRLKDRTIRALVLVLGETFARESTADHCTTSHPTLFSLLLSSSLSTPLRLVWRHQDDRRGRGRSWS